MKLEFDKGVKSRHWSSTCNVATGKYIEVS